MGGGADSIQKGTPCHLSQVIQQAVMKALFWLVLWVLLLVVYVALPRTSGFSNMPPPCPSFPAL